MPRRQERSAGFVVFHSRTRAASEVSGAVEYLLLDSGRHWDFPKGHLKKKEADLEAATRELEEETGIADVHRIPGFEREIEYHFRNRHDDLIHKTVVFFLGQVKNQEIVLSDEHVGSAYLPYEQALERATFPTAKQLLTAAHEFLARADLKSF